MAVARFKQDFSPVTAGGGGRGGGFKPYDTGVRLNTRPLRFRPVNDRAWSRSAYRTFEKRLKGAFSAVGRAGTLASAAALSRLGRIEWASQPWTPGATGVPLPVFPGFTLQCDMTATADCTSLYGGVPGPVRFGGDVGYPLIPCGSPIYVCNNFGDPLTWFETAPEVGPTTQLAMGLDHSVAGALSVRAIWTAPVAITPPLPLGRTLPLDQLNALDWAYPTPFERWHPAPRPLQRPWRQLDPEGRPHPRASHIRARELSWPNVRTAKSANARAKTARHHQRPDRAGKHAGAGTGRMAVALGTLHTLTELKDALGALNKALPKSDRGKGLYGQLNAVFEHAEYFFTPEGITRASEELLKEHLSDKIVGRLFGARFAGMPGGIPGTYQLSAPWDAAHNDPYGNRDGTGLGPIGPSTAFPWNQ